MLANLGFGALAITFFVSLYGIGASLYGLRQKESTWIKSARNAMLLTFPLLTISVLSLVLLLIGDHFEVVYVASVSSRSMPLHLKATALWGGQAGSLVFWSWTMSAFASAVTLRRWDQDRELLPWVIIVCLVNLTFFLSLNLTIENPFVRLWLPPSGKITTSLFQPKNASLFIPNDGPGLNPLLRHPGMIFHPPTLYLGFVAFVIPYAFAIAALITRQTDDHWIRTTRRWTLWAWLFLSLGLVLGARWAYDVLGWGGYWGWDPVEISALMPWLTGTAFLHSVMIQEKRGMFKRWNMVLIIMTYSLVIFGTFLTRSGVLSSVHAFAQSAVGPLFFAFIGITLSLSLWLLLSRWDDLGVKKQITSMLSRESLFLFNNLLFIGILIVSFWGVIFPLISELVTGQKVTVGPPFYERANGPLMAGLLLLMGVAPLSAWGRSTIQSLGRAIWKPTIAAVIVVIAVIFGGIRNPAALIGFFLVALVIAVTLMEYWRGMRARVKCHDENPFQAIWALTRRNQRRYGGYLIHLSMAMIAIGMLGIELFQSETQGTLSQGESLSLGAYTITYQSLNVADTQDGRNVAEAAVAVEKNGHPLTVLNPRREFFYDHNQSMTIPAVRSTIEDDIYILLIDWREINTDSATFKVYRNPLVKWLWLGSGMFVVGTLVAVWPDRKKNSG